MKFFKLRTLPIFPTYKTVVIGYLYNIANRAFSAKLLELRVQGNLFRFLRLRLANIGQPLYVFGKNFQKIIGKKLSRKSLDLLIISTPYSYKIQLRKSSFGRD